MKATTIKIEGDLLKELDRIRPSHSSFSAFVREVLEREVVRKKMERAAEEYTAFLASHADERDFLETWAEAPLDKEPSTKGRK